MRDARDARPGVAICLVWLTLWSGVFVVACAPSRPEIPTERRVWEGPTNTVASSGVVHHERREIAQQIAVPACISVGSDQYRFDRIEPFAGGGTNPPGLNDTFHRLDRWRLWTDPGPLEGHAQITVTIRGSTGIVAQYERLPAGETCIADG
ncbi:MAG: hypothetical protein AB7R89_03955 [Dehalococcoidia bacterium]